MGASDKRAEIGIAVMGYGVVGKGVAHAIRNNSDLIEKKTGLRIRLLHVLDILDFPESPDAGIVTHDVGDIMRDDGVRVVVETMGGLKTAFEYTKLALSLKKHVVTSNKELVAEFGPELLSIADHNSVHYAFDASVGGGIPVITPLEECLAANDIKDIIGILNGTTNYMLSYMKSHGSQFMETLKMAQRMGYAENNPAADLTGADACRKLSILSSIAWGRFLDWKQVHTEGLEGATLGDIRRAADLGRVLKLIAQARRRDDGRFEACVMPAMIDRRSPLANVEGVNNAVLIHGDLTGEVMFYGQGAGMIPTGGAIVSDIIKIFRGGEPVAVKNPRWVRDAALDTADFSEYVHGYYVRAATPDREAYAGALFRGFPEAKILPEFAEDAACDFVYTVPQCAEGEFLSGLARINEATKGSETKFIARMQERQADNC